VRTPPPPVLLLGSIASVQFGAAFADKLFAQAGPGGVVFLRLSLSAIILLALARPSLRNRSRRDLLAALAFGVILAAMNWSFYEAIDRLPLGSAVTIEFVGPLAVAVVGSRRGLDIVWVLLAAGGVTLLSTRGDHRAITGSGVALALFAAACWAGYILLSKRVGSAFAALDGLAIALGVGAVLLVPVGLVQGGTALLRPSVLGGGLAVALLSSLIPYSLEITALRRLSSAAFGILMSLEPAVAALAGVVVLSQPLTGVLLIALVMVAAASLGSTLAARPNSADPAVEAMAADADRPVPPPP
jgi:inner membrane transporter RhtA